MQVATNPHSPGEFRANGVVRLSVVHDGFDSGSLVFEAIRDGWPPLLSSLKTFLETGEPLDFKM